MDQPAPDVFISHATEDKDAVARPLREALIARGWTVWLDEIDMTVGDSLQQQIDAALRDSRFGVVILSPAFFSKEWPRKELEALGAREVELATKVILPVWHQMTRRDVLQRSPMLAGRLAAPTERGIDYVAHEISRALLVAGHRGPARGETEHLVQPVPCPMSSMSHHGLAPSAGMALW